MSDTIPWTSRNGIRKNIPAITTRKNHPQGTSTSAKPLETAITKVSHAMLPIDPSSTATPPTALEAALIIEQSHSLHLSCHKLVAECEPDGPRPCSPLVFSLFSRPPWLRHTLSHFAALAATAGRQSSSFWRIICQRPSRWPGNMEGRTSQSRFDKSTAQAQEMKEGALRVL